MDSYTVCAYESIAQGISLIFQVLYVVLKEHSESL